MRVLRSLLLFWYGFIVGDDWSVAAGVVAAMAATAVVAYQHVPAWWLLPAAVVVLLALSLARATRRAGESSGGDGVGTAGVGAERRGVRDHRPGGAAG